MADPVSASASDLAVGTDYPGTTNQTRLTSAPLPDGFSAWQNVELADGQHVSSCDHPDWLWDDNRATTQVALSLQGRTESRHNKAAAAVAVVGFSGTIALFVKAGVIGGAILGSAGGPAGAAVGATVGALCGACTACGAWMIRNWGKKKADRVTPQDSNVAEQVAALRNHYIKKCAERGRLPDPYESRVLDTCRTLGRRYATQEVPSDPLASDASQENCEDRQVLTPVQRYLQKTTEVAMRRFVGERLKTLGPGYDPDTATRELATFGRALWKQLEQFVTTTQCTVGEIYHARMVTRDELDEAMTDHYAKIWERASEADLASSAVDVITRRGHQSFRNNLLSSHGASKTEPLEKACEAGLDANKIGLVDRHRWAVEMRRDGGAVKQFYNHVLSERSKLGRNGEGNPIRARALDLLKATCEYVYRSLAPERDPDDLRRDFSQPVAISQQVSDAITRLEAFVAAEEIGASPSLQRPEDSVQTNTVLERDEDVGLVADIDEASDFSNNAAVFSDWSATHQSTDE